MVIRNRKIGVFEIVTWVALALVFIADVVTVAACWKHFVDADMSSDMLLAQLLSEEGAPLSENWYYSSEMRVLSTQLIMAPLFAITSDWVVVRTLSSAILYVILLLCLRYFTGAVKMHRYFALMGCILLLPLSPYYTMYVLQNLIYIVYFSIAFLTLGMLLRARNLNLADKKQRVRFIVIAVCGSLLALLACMNGIRQILFLYMPLVLLAVYFYLRHRERAEKKFIVLVILFFVFSGVGYVFNSTVLREYFLFYDYGSLVWDAFSMDKLGIAITCIFEAYGFCLEGSVFSSALFGCVSSVVLVCITVAACVSVLRHPQNYNASIKIVTLFMVVAFAIMMCASVFTDTYNFPRYWMPFLIFSLPVDIAYLKDMKKLDARMAKTLGGASLVLLALSSLMMYRYVWTVNPNETRQEVVDFAMSKGLEDGYATFWDANAMTELSGGKIDMFSWGDKGDKWDFIEFSEGPVEDFLLDKIDVRMLSMDQRYKWLQLKSHDEDVPTDGSFLVFPKERLDEGGIAQALAEGATPSFENEDYVVYIYTDVADVIDDYIENNDEFKKPNEADTEKSNG